MTIDGIDAVNQILGANFRADDLYLMRNLERLLEGDGGVHVLTYNWGGNTSDTTTHVAALRTILRNDYTYVRARGGRFVIVAHSWGTVLAYLALAFESRGADPIIPDLFITLGSPLGAFEAVREPGALTSDRSAAELIVIDELGDEIQAFNPSECTSGRSVSCAPRGRRQINFWAWSDPVSGPIRGAWENYRVDTTAYVSADFARSMTSSNRGSISLLITWHTFESLDFNAVPNNAVLRQAVRNLILGR